MKIKQLLVLVLLAATPLAFAQSLKWEDEAIALKTKIGDKTAIAIYKFENTSDQTIEITNTKASCGCTVPSLEKKVYAPGEKGELQAKFDIAQRSGKQLKYIDVTTNEVGQEKPYKLKLEVDIPQAITVTPRIRIWTKGSEAEEMEISIELHEDMPMDISGITPINEDVDKFDIKIVAVEDKKSYTIKITPKSLEERARGRFHLASPDDKNGILSKFPLYAYVR